MRHHAVGALAVALLITAGGCADSVTETDGPALIQLYAGDLQRATVQTTLPEQLVVEVLDAHGQPVGGARVTFTTESGGTLSPPTPVTNAEGHARSTYALGPTAGPQAVMATVAGLPPVSFTIRADADTASRLAVVDGDGQGGVAGASLAAPITVRVTDAFGNAIGAVEVAFDVRSGSVTPRAAATDTSGHAVVEWTLGSAAGEQWLTARSGGMIDSALATAAAGPAARVTFVSGDGQAGTRSARLLAPLIVKVTDTFGNPVGAAAVTFSASDGGSISPASVPTDADGLVAVEWTLGAPLRVQTAIAAVAGVGSDTATAVASVPLAVLDHVVIDAVYDPAHDRILTVSANPDRLNLVDPASGAVTSIALSLAPAAVSVQPGGAFAAVGHNGFISYVDLAAQEVAQVYGVTADVIDLELPGNGWVYAFPRVDQWETIRSVELATGTETTTGTIRAGTLVKLHPSLEYIYGADNGLSPSDFEKYDIRGGAAVYLYDSPYHGDYAFGGNVWIYDDGSRLVARTGNVFSSSALRAEDMLYVGSLGGSLPIGAADHSTDLGRIVVTRTSQPWVPQAVSTLESYTADFLAYQGSLGLPSYVEMGASGPTAYASEGHFVFVGTGGARVYVLVRGAYPNAARFRTGLALFDAADLP